MKILHIVSSLDLSQGGPPNAIISLAESQKRYGHEVRIASSFKKISGKKKKVKIIKGNFLFRRFYIPNLDFVIKIYKELNHCDIVHLHGVWNGVISISAFLSRIKKKKVIITPHGSLDSYNIRNKYIFKKIYYFFVEKFNLDYVHAFHFLTSNELRNSLWIKLIKKKKCLIQTNGINFHEIRKLKIDKKIFSNEKNKIITYLGRLNKIKNIDLQIELINELVKKKRLFKLNIIGPDDGMLKKLKTKVKKLNLHNNIIFKKPIYGKEKYNWLKKSDIVILTSFYECNSVTGIETMALGGVLLATKNCNLQDAGKDGAVKICGYRLNELIKSVNFLSIKKNSNMVRQKALKYAHKNLNIKYNSKNILDFYKKIINKTN